MVLPLVLPVLFQSLQDRDDDPRSVAAAALVPTADVLVTDYPHQVCIIKVHIYNNPDSG